MTWIYGRQCLYNSLILFGCGFFRVNLNRSIPSSKGDIGANEKVGRGAKNTQYLKAKAGGCFNGKESNSI